MNQRSLDRVRTLDIGDVVQCRGCRAFTIADPDDVVPLAWMRPRDWRVVWRHAWSGETWVAVRKAP